MENLSTESIGVVLELHQVEDTESLVSPNVHLCGLLSSEFSEITRPVYA